MKLRRTNPLKIAVSGGLFVLSVIFALLSRTPARALAAAAMGISFAADALLAGYPVFLAKVKNRLTKGGLLFLAVHMLYIMALIVSAGKGAGALSGHFAFPFAVFLALTAAHGALFYFRIRSSVPLSFFAASFIYLLTAGAHAAAAFAAAGLTGGGYILNIVGALLFYLSDAILLARKYGAYRGKRGGLLIWATYAPAQLCILTGFFLAR